MATSLRRTEAFCERFGLRLPILQVSTAGACPPELAIAVANAGGMGGAGVLLGSPKAIAQWLSNFGRTLPAPSS